MRRPEDLRRKTQGACNVNIQIPETIDTLEGVDSKYHPLFVKAEDGKFKFKDFSGIESALTAKKKESAELGDKVKGLEGQLEKLKGIDLDEFNRLKGLEEEAKQAKQAAAGQIDEVKRQIQAAADAKVAGEKQVADALRGAFGKFVKDLAVREELSKANVTDGGLELLLQNISSQVAVSWDGTSPKLTLLDDKGAPRRNESFDEMTIKDLVDEAKEKLPVLFKSPGASGGGSNPVDTSEAPTDGKPSSWTPAQKAAYRNKHGSQAWQRLVAKEATDKAEALGAKKVQGK